MTYFPVFTVVVPNIIGDDGLIYALAVPLQQIGCWDLKGEITQGPGGASSCTNPSISSTRASLYGLIRRTKTEVPYSRTVIFHTPNRDR